MPLDPLTARAAALSDRLAPLSARDRIAAALDAAEIRAPALLSSFGADSVVLLHLVSEIAPDLPVLFLDTQMLFPETLDYQRAVAGRLGLRDVRTIRARALRLAQADPANLLHRTDPDACCALRKTEPLTRALAPFDAWFTGRKRAQSDSRAGLPFAEADGPRIKLNPLADWTAADLNRHIDAHALPRHPLVARGYPSIGCAPCTAPVRPGEDARAGRWRGQSKDECGIHFVGGRLVRSAAPQTGASRP